MKINLNEIDEFNLLLFISRPYGVKKIAKILSNYSGCSTDYYDEAFLTKNYQLVAAAVVRRYPKVAGSFVWEYFWYKRLGGSELDALFAGLIGIKPSKFSAADIRRMRKLKTKYVDPVVEKKNTKEIK